MWPADRFDSDTRLRCRGACTRFHPRTAQHTHTCTRAKKTHAGTCETNTDALACTHTKTHTHMQGWRFHTQTHIGVLCRSGALPPVQTHTRSHAERGGQMESQRGLLAFHTPETWFLTDSSPSTVILPSLIPLTPFSSCSPLILVNASSPRFYLLLFFHSLTFFSFVPQTRAFASSRRRATKVDCIEQTAQLTMLLLFFPKTLSDSERMMKGQKEKKKNLPSCHTSEEDLIKSEPEKEKKEDLRPLGCLCRKYWLQVKSN